MKGYETKIKFGIMLVESPENGLETYFGQFTDENSPYTILCTDKYRNTVSANAAYARTENIMQCRGDGACAYILTVQISSWLYDHESYADRIGMIRTDFDIIKTWACRMFGSGSIPVICENYRMPEPYVSFIVIPEKGEMDRYEDEEFLQALHERLRDILMENGHACIPKEYHPLKEAG